MKYECKSCGLECSVESDFEPTVCLKTGIICYGWHKTKAPLGFKTKDDVFVFAITNRGWGYIASKEGKFYTLSEITEKIQLDGSPCGVAEVAK